MRVERVAGLGPAPSVLRALASATALRGLPPPAALTGDWFGSRAVIVPSVAIEPVGVGDVFDTTPGSSGDEVGGG
ncbi:MAG: para-aminobenzoate synthetase component, partial [Mycobacterium sp.]|nr:para-aminobenzoate synthetase component [Mycobacterium sp.]